MKNKIYFEAPAPPSTGKELTTTSVKKYVAGGGALKTVTTDDNKYYTTEVATVMYKIPKTREFLYVDYFFGIIQLLNKQGTKYNPALQQVFFTKYFPDIVVYKTGAAFAKFLGKNVNMVNEKIVELLGGKTIPNNTTTLTAETPETPETNTQPAQVGNVAQNKPFGTFAPSGQEGGRTVMPESTFHKYDNIFRKTLSQYFEAEMPTNQPNNQSDKYGDEVRKLVVFDPPALTGGSYVYRMAYIPKRETNDAKKPIATFFYDVSSKKIKMLKGGKVIDPGKNISPNLLHRILIGEYDFDTEFQSMTDYAKASDAAVTKQKEKQKAMDELKNAEKTGLGEGRPNPAKNALDKKQKQKEMDELKNVEKTGLGGGRPNPRDAKNKQEGDSNLKPKGDMNDALLNQAVKDTEADKKFVKQNMSIEKVSAMVTNSKAEVQKAILDNVGKKNKEVYINIDTGEVFDINKPPRKKGKYVLFAKGSNGYGIQDLFVYKENEYSPNISIYKPFFEEISPIIDELFEKK